MPAPVVAVQRAAVPAALAPTRSASAARCSAGYSRGAGDRVSRASKARLRRGGAARPTGSVGRACGPPWRVACDAPRERHRRRVARACSAGGPLARPLESSGWRGNQLGVAASGVDVHAVRNFRAPRPRSLSPPPRSATRQTRRAARTGTKADLPRPERVEELAVNLALLHAGDSDTLSSTKDVA